MHSLLLTFSDVYNSTELFHRLMVLNACKQKEHPFPVPLLVSGVMLCRLWVSPSCHPLGKRDKQKHAVSMKVLLWHCFFSLFAMWSGEPIRLLMRSLPEEGQNGPKILFL